MNCFNTTIPFRNKLRRERAKLRAEAQKEENILFEKVTGIGFDGRRDAALQNCEINGKYHTSTLLEEHYVITGEPGKYQAPINYKKFKKNFAMQCCSSILFEGNEHILKKINMQRTKVLVGS